MGLFSSLFGKKKPFKVHNKVWMLEETKNKMLAEQLKNSSTKTLLVSFFDETYKRMETLVADLPQVKLMKASDIVQRRKDTDLKIWFSQTDKELLFAEHYPLLREEEEVLQYLAELSGAEVNAQFYISLEDPLIIRFSGDKIKSMMERMGMAAEENLQHTMIDNSIQRAQEKLQEKIPRAIKTNSAAEWFKVNAA